MTTILYREITSDGQHTEIIEEFTQLDLKKFAKSQMALMKALSWKPVIFRVQKKW